MNAPTNDAPKDCPQGQVCFYENFEYSNLVDKKPPTDDCVTIAAGFTSVYNNSEKTIRIYDSKEGCWGDPVRINAHSGKPTLTYKSYSFKSLDDDSD